MFAPALLLFMATSFGATYSAEIAVTSSYTGNGEPAGVRRVLATVGGPDQTVTTTDPRITCGVNNGALYAQFVSPPASWPTSWPVTGTCTSGSEVLNVSVVPMSASVDLSQQPTALVGGDTFVFTRPATANVLYSVPLVAADGPYVNGLVSATLDGVNCMVQGVAPAQHVAMQMSHTSQTGSGQCKLPRSGKADFALNLQLDAGPY